MRTARRVTRLLAALALVAAAVIVTGCATSRTGSVPAKPAAAAGADVPAPTVKLVAPVEGAEVPAGDLTVAVETTGLTFVMPSNTIVPGEGHVHFSLDGGPIQMSTTPEYVLKDVAPGPHTLEAELVQNDTESFDPPVLQEITFTAK